MEVLGAGALFAAIVGGLVSGVQFGFLWWKERREKRQAQAQFGYKLLDALFGDAHATDLLYALDYGRRPVNAPSLDLATSFPRAFGPAVESPLTQRSPAHEYVDALLFHFDRFEHAIRAGLALFEDVEIPTGYYVTLLRPSRRTLEEYARRVGYGRAVAFLSRFESWRTQ